MGASVAEVARACEVNPNVLYRWRRELRKYAAKAFPGEGHRRIVEGQCARTHFPDLNSISLGGVKMGSHATPSLQVSDKPTIQPSGLLPLR